MKKLFLGCSIFLAIIVVAMTIAMVILGKDDASPEDSDLWPARREITSENNGHSSLVAAAKGLDWPEEDRWLSEMLEGKRDWDSQQVQLVLDKNAEPLSQLEAALAKEDLQFPMIERLNDPLPDFRAFMQLGNLLRIRSLASHQSGNLEAAFEDALRLVALGEKLEQSESSLITYVVGSSGRQRGFDLLVKLLGSDGLDLRLLKRCQVALGNLKKASRGLEIALAIEYGMVSRGIDDLASGKLGLNAIQGGDDKEGGALDRIGAMPYVFMPNRTKRQLANTFRTFIKNAPKLCSAMEKPSLPPMPKPGFVGQFAYLLAPNPVGRVLASIVLPGFEHVFTEKCAEETLLAELLTATSLRCHQLKTGTMAPSVTEIDPECSTGEALDGFEGKPLHYDAAQGKLQAAIAEGEGKYAEKARTMAIELGFP